MEVQRVIDSISEEGNMFDPKTRILIVDDMLPMRKSVANVCKELGFGDLTEASDGLLAMDQLVKATRPIGLIISDWNMPNCTGLEFLKNVRADARFVKIPFILLTAEAEQGQILEAVKAGVSSYVVKPFTPEVLKARIESVHQAYIKKYPNEAGAS